MSTNATSDILSSEACDDNAVSGTEQADICDIHGKPYQVGDEVITTIARGTASPEGLLMTVTAVEGGRVTFRSTFETTTHLTYDRDECLHYGIAIVNPSSEELEIEFNMLSGKLVPFRVQRGWTVQATRLGLARLDMFRHFYTVKLVYDGVELCDGDLLDGFEGQSLQVIGMSVDLPDGVPDRCPCFPLGSMCTIIDDMKSYTTHEGGATALLLTKWRCQQGRKLRNGASVIVVGSLGPGEMGVSHMGHMIAIQDVDDGEQYLIKAEGLKLV